MYDVIGRMCTLFIRINGEKMKTKLKKNNIWFEVETMLTINFEYYLHRKIDMRVRECRWIMLTWQKNVYMYKRKRNQMQHIGSIPFILWYDIDHSLKWAYNSVYISINLRQNFINFMNTISAAYFKIVFSSVELVKCTDEKKGKHTNN